MNAPDCMDMVPSQPLLRTSVRSMSARRPESVIHPVTWTAAAVPRSATAFLAIWPALSVASGLAVEPALVPALPQPGGAGRQESGRKRRRQDALPHPS